MANKQYKNCSKLKKDKQNLEMREEKKKKTNKKQKYLQMKRNLYITKLSMDHHFVSIVVAIQYLYSMDHFLIIPIVF